MSVSVTNLTQGPGTLYRGAFGQAEPADTQVNTTPAASGWTDVGGTLGGVTLTVNQKYKELEVDQIVDTVGRRLVEREARIETDLAEPTLANLALTLNASTPVTGAGFAYYEPPNDTSASTPTYCALIFDGIAPGGFTRRIVLRRALSVADVKFGYAKDKQSVFSASFAAHFVSAAIKPFRIVDATA